MKKLLSLLSIAAFAWTLTACSGDDKPDPTPPTPPPPTEVSVTGVSLNKNAVTLVVGEIETLTATVAPADATNKAIAWSSNATTVATVDANGKVTALAPGTATITVTTTDGSKSASCVVTVPEPNDYLDPSLHVGVVIDGIRWAEANVVTPGFFASKTEDYGDYYTAAEALEICPEGWRIPDRDDFLRLVASENEWTTVNGITGRQFGSGENTLFFPAAGFFLASSDVVTAQGQEGSYWSSSMISDENTYGNVLNFGIDFPGRLFSFTHTNNLRLLSVRCVTAEPEPDTEPEPTSDGVEIAGLTWAVRNVAETGNFAAHSSDYGNLYSYEEAQTACPEGWRMPNGDELRALHEQTSVWTSIQGVFGRRFGFGDKSIFLPAAGFRDADGSAGRQGSNGYYIGTTTGNGRILVFEARSTNLESRWDAAIVRFSVRCVKQKTEVIPTNGIEINGIVWAGSNVAESGTFAPNSWDIGNQYTFDEAQTVCPEGWRTPNGDELWSLSGYRGEGFQINGVHGRRYTDGNNALFLPVTGYEDSGTIASQGMGYYWSSNTDAYSFLFLYSEDSMRSIIREGRDFSHLKFSVRCVKE